MKNRVSIKIYDFFMQLITNLASLFTLIVLVAIVVFIVTSGYKLINFKLIFSDYQAQRYVAELRYQNTYCNCDNEYVEDSNTFFSEKWGIALSNETDLLGKNVIVVEYISPNSPFKALIDKGINTDSIRLEKGHSIIRIAFNNSPTALSRYGAQSMIESLEVENSIRELEFSYGGGGIRGSIVTTLYLVFLTLMIALPIGVGSAIYLNEYAKNNKFNHIIRTFIETLTGVPSIIYGLMGLAVFVPLTVRLTNATGGNILSGAMTLSVILLPIIIRTTEESLKVVPIDYRHASLALGASNTQTVFKVILPSATQGILTSVLLAIGRIVGESAALVFAIGATIKDQISITGKSTSLAVHIWALMTDEPANIELSSTISLIILLIVFALNISIKIISNRYEKKRLGRNHG